MRKPMIAFVSALLLACMSSITVHAALPQPDWQPGINDWGIYGKAVGAGADIFDTDKEKLRSQLKNTELYTVETMLQRTKPGGGCYGSAVTSLLSAYGLIDYSQFPHENGTIPRGLTDIGYPYLRDTGLIEDVKVPAAAVNLLQYYHCLQCTDAMRQNSAWLRYSTTQAERGKMLLEILESGKPVLVSTWTGIVSEGQTGHAVVAYGVEDCDVKRNNHYDKHILIYDPNFPRKSTIPEGVFSSDWLDWNDSIYLNSETGDWCLQWLGGSYAEGYLDCIVDDINLLNMHGLLEGTEPYVSDKPFLGVMTSNWIGQKHNLQTFRLQDGAIRVEGNAAYMETPSFYPDNNANTALNYLTEDIDSGYLMTLEKPQELETVMFYENSIGKAKSDQAKETAVTPDGYVSLKGESASYELEYCLNEGHYAGAWYQVSVKGKAADAALQMTEQGWILKADSLYHVQVRAKEKNGSDHTLMISTDESLVLFSENDKNEITASVDMNGDGIFETKLPDLSEKLGDVDENGTVNSADATAILRDSAQRGVGRVSDLSKEQILIADADSNGVINSSDATQILIYAAKVGTGFTGTLQEFMDESD